MPFIPINIYKVDLLKLNMVNVLVLGQYPRATALTRAAWQSKNVYKSGLVEEIFIAPGNAATAHFGVNINLDINDFDAVVEFCKSKDIKFILTDSEDQIAAGIVDVARKVGIYCVGPVKELAWVEADKGKARDAMKEAGIPIPEYIVSNNVENARKGIRYMLKKYGACYAKYSHLYGGKGAPRVETEEQMEKYLIEFSDHSEKKGLPFSISIEEPLTGYELSSYYICGVSRDGEPIWRFVGDAEDYKYSGHRIKEGSSFFKGQDGPVTGGMGSNSPSALILNANLTKQIEEDIIAPFLKHIANKGTPYTGVLYFGGIADHKDGDWTVKVIEFNMRFGDPEEATIQLRRESDIVPFLLASAGHPDFWLEDQPEMKISKEVTVNFVFATHNYPSNYKPYIDKIIHGLEKIEGRDDIFAYLGPTYLDGEDIKTKGSRVMELVARGKNYHEARQKVLELVGLKENMIGFDQMQFNIDIGTRAIDVEWLFR